MTAKHSSARARVIAPRIRNTPLHPTASARRFNGPLAATAPTFPTAMTIPVSTAKSCFGNHTDIIFMRGMYTTAIPAAIMIFPMTIISKLCPMKVRKEPMEATARKAAQDLLGPMRSARSPLGICMAVYVQKYTELRIPTDPPTSATMSVPTMLRESLWKYTKK